MGSQSHSNVRDAGMEYQELAPDMEFWKVICKQMSDACA
jgi:hypothetical protein